MMKQFNADTRQPVAMLQEWYLYDGTYILSVHFKYFTTLR